MSETGGWKRFLDGRDRPLVCGIVNVTPDSFSDGGLFFDTKAAIAHGLTQIEAGADLLDIGGESTRPGASPVSADEELSRVLPVIEAIHQKADIPISIDTMKPDVAKAAFAAGASIWNDVSALRFDANSLQTARELDGKIILMHMAGTPQTMQQNPQYADVVAEIINWLQTRITQAREAGIALDKLMVDPGIGFGKSLDHNLALLTGLQRISNETQCPVMLGASRKRFIAALDAVAGEDQRLGGSLAAVAAAFAQKTAMVRVHDVSETAQMLKVQQAIYQAGSLL